MAKPWALASYARDSMNLGFIQSTKGIITPVSIDLCKDLGLLDVEYTSQLPIHLHHLSPWNPRPNQSEIDEVILPFVNLGDSLVLVPQTYRSTNSSSDYIILTNGTEKITIRIR